MMTRALPSDFYARLQMDVLEHARLCLREKADEIQVALTIARETGGTSSDELAQIEARIAQLRAAASSDDPMDAVEAYLKEIEG